MANQQLSIILCIFTFALYTFSHQEAGVTFDIVSAILTFCKTYTLFKEGGVLITYLHL